ncbi:MAG: nucleoside-diphosphate kinase [Longimicrobiales bacterium]|nr:nucleoside-diphosphate kinase [Longimicrobiales bacterium]
MQYTLGIIKPNAVSSGYTGKILSKLEDSNFSMEAIRVMRLNSENAGAFYAVHKERPFFPSLVAFMTSGPIVPVVLQKKDAVSEFRRVIGATDPNEAEDGTIRKLYGVSIEENAIHGSDSSKNARIEIEFFFPDFFTSI